MRTNNNIVQVETEDGNNVNIGIPVGSLDRPTERGEELFKQVTGSSHWKDATEPYVTRNMEEANELAYTLEWYHGGVEMESVGDSKIRVYSLGYYHYVG